MKFNSIFKSIARYQKVSAILYAAGLIGSSCSSDTPSTEPAPISSATITPSTESVSPNPPTITPSTEPTSPNPPIIIPPAIPTPTNLPRNTPSTEPTSPNLPIIAPLTEPVLSNLPFSGIPNIGGVTCFMNSVLQILAAGYKDNIKGGPLARMITKINNKQVQVKRKDIDEFIDGLSDTDTLKEMFESRQQQDTHEFLTRLDDYYKFLETSIYYERIFIMDHQRFLFKDNNKIEETILKLDFDTKELQNTKDIPQMIRFSHQGPMDMDDEYRIHPNEFSTCPNTPSLYVEAAFGPNCKAFRQKIIDHLPSKLCIQINRFNPLSPTKIEAPLQGTNVVKIKRDPNDANTAITFHLNGFIVHIGNSMQGGHYVAYVKREGVWYIADDTVVRKISEQQAIAQSQGAYLLFYEKQ